MLGENIKILRKQKGVTQEALAQQLNVVRQTVSKWEKGLSVPDADMLAKIADYFEVPVSSLLGGKIDEMDTHDVSRDKIDNLMVLLNEQFAIQNRRREKALRIVAVVVILAFVLPLVVFLWNYWQAHKPVGEVTTAHLTCTLDGETYLYDVVYDETNHVIKMRGDSYVKDHIRSLKTIASEGGGTWAVWTIEAYFEGEGGTVEVVYETAS